MAAHEDVAREATFGSLPVVPAAVHWPWPVPFPGSDVPLGPELQDPDPVVRAPRAAAGG